MPGSLQNKGGTMVRIKTSSPYPRKVVRQGGARTISVGKILPSDWLIVAITVVKRSEKTYVLKLEKIL
uniref:Uncharacterized protein n=1 Tax=viral metagenome TaxID=1070528 RepID=A0A6H2A3F0_9ZZZZ